MISFTWHHDGMRDDSGVDVRILPDGTVMLLRNLHYRLVFDDGREFFHTTGQGFVCDLSSQPSFLPLPDKLKSSGQAIWHDEGYRFAERFQLELDLQGLGDIQANQAFFDWTFGHALVRDRQVGPVWGWVMQKGVEWFGDRTWRRHRERAEREGTHLGKRPFVTERPPRRGP